MVEYKYVVITLYKNTPVDVEIFTTELEALNLKALKENQLREFKEYRVLVSRAVNNK